MKKVYPARFIGETTYPEVYDFMRDGNIGDVAVVARTDNGGQSDHGPYIAIRCGCGLLKLVALAPFAFSNGASWRLLKRDPVHLDPSVLSPPGEKVRCHFFVHDGELQMLADTTAALK